MYIHMYTRTTARRGAARRPTEASRTHTHSLGTLVAGWPPSINPRSWRSWCLGRSLPPPPPNAVCHSNDRAVWAKARPHWHSHVPSSVPHASPMAPSPDACHLTLGSTATPPQRHATAGVPGRTDGHQSPVNVASSLTSRPSFSVCPCHAAPLPSSRNPVAWLRVASQPGLA